MEEILENWYNIEVENNITVNPVDITEQNIELFSELWKEYVDNEFIFGVERAK